MADYDPTEQPYDEPFKHVDAILPCPFCGGKAERHDIEAREDVDNAGASYIECSRCGACTQLYFDRKENLLDSWNQRAKEPAEDEVARLRFDLRACRGRAEIDQRNLRHWREECGKLHAREAAGDGAAKYGELFQAVADYRDYLERSVNVGPLTNNPSKEAMLLRRLWELVPKVSSSLTSNQRTPQRE